MFLKLKKTHTQNIKIGYWMSQILHLNRDHDDSLERLRKNGRGRAAIFLLTYKLVSYYFTKHKNF